MNSKSPLVSVVMSVYNAADYLRESIDSILSQSFDDFEFIIINDGSTDKSLSIIKSYNDPRIRLVDQKNMGLVSSLNKGVGLAKGSLIARQDADDISLPMRFEQQVAYLQTHARAGLVGSNYILMDQAGQELTSTSVFTHPDDLKLTLITCNQYGHGSIMMRKEAFEKAGGYDKKVGYVEDYDLWVKISRQYDVANIEEPLYKWRKSEESITHSNLDLQIKQTFAVRDKAFKHFLTHRREYRVLSYHPSGQNYRLRKATLYRDLAYLYRANDRPIGALLMLKLALLMEPLNKKTWRLLLLAVYKPRFDRWEYEFL